MQHEFPSGAHAGAVWRALCVSCGKTSEDFAFREDALRWREHHQLEDAFLSDVVIECRFRRPGGTETRIFEQA
jgi:hypothetical protein